MHSGEQRAQFGRRAVNPGAIQSARQRKISPPISQDMGNNTGVQGRFIFKSRFDFIRPGLQRSKGTGSRKAQFIPAANGKHDLFSRQPLHLF